jgi:type II secretory pathway pseudopilin PulG
MKDNIIINKYSGFFLIELLVALGILAMVCLVTAHFHANISEQKYEAKKYMSALNVLNSFIDESYIYGFTGKIIKIDSFKIEIEDIFQFPFLIKEGEQSKTKKFQMKKISISWESLKGKERRIFLICGFIL